MKERVEIAGAMDALANEHEYVDEAVTWVRTHVEPKLLKALTELGLHEREVPVVIQNLVFFINENCRREKNFDGGLAQALYQLVRSSGVIAQSIYNNIPFPEFGTSQAQEAEATFRRIIHSTVYKGLINKD